MNEMIERVGDAMFAAMSMGEDPIDREHPCWNTLARAAIAAMREPSREQYLAMQSALLKHYPVVFDGEACIRGSMMEALYQAGIDAALSEPPTGG